jgi:tRNA threonylcarbamoyladenosine biosynthesis protein TsaB
MIILSLRTDKPDAELGIFEDEQQLGYEVWQAHRELSDTIHRTLEVLLARVGKSLHDIQGIVCFKGPGSFTGLRIGISVANALAYGLDVPIVATDSEEWLHRGIAGLLRGADEHLALPEYGAPVHITIQKH